MTEFKKFDNFYPFYLSQHQNQICRLLHFVGTTLVILYFFVFLITFQPFWLLLMPVAGYGFAWIGHAFFENNKPATFKYPFYSLMGDFVMYKDMVMGKLW